MNCRWLPVKGGLLFPFLVLLFCGSAWAQNLGSVRGRVTDASGAAMPGTTVEIVNQGTNVTRTVVTDSTGTYVLTALNPGIYTIRVKRQGFSTFVRRNVQVLVSSSTTVPIPLQIGSVSQTVTVQATSAPLLNTTDATTGNPFNENQVKNLPFLARNVVDLLSLQPGVVSTGMSDTDLLALGTTSKMDNREGVVNGVQGNQSNITVDGVDANNWMNQAAFSSALPLTLDSIQEVRVVTANSNASDGSAAGGQVAIVTKGGSNNFHGNARWYYRTSGLSANSYFNNLDRIARPKLLRNIAGGSIGGHIIRNRLFFFLDNEDRRDSSGSTQGPRSVPSNALKDGVLIYGCAVPSQCPGGTVQGITTSHAVPAGAFGLGPADLQKIDPAHLGVNPAMIKYMSLFPSGNVPSAGLDGGLSFTGFRFNAPSDLSSNIYFARIDYNLTRDGRQTIFWRGNLIGAADTLVGAQFPGQTPAQSLLDNSRGSEVQYQYQISPALIETLRWGFTRFGSAFSGVTGPSLTVRDYASNVNFGARPNSVRIPDNEINDTLNWLHGKHTLGFGGTLNFVQIQRDNAAASYPAFAINPGTCQGQCADAYANVTGILNDPTPVSSQYFTEPFMMLTGPITTANATLFSNPHTQTFLPPGTVDQRITNEREYGVFVQDIWQARTNLSITGGLGYNYQTPPWEANGYEVAPTTDLDAWFSQRVANMNKGIASHNSPLLSWNVAGAANGKPGWYAPDHKNFAPHVGIAWSPNYRGALLNNLLGHPGQSVWRAGFGVYYDRIGEPIALDSDNYGSPGLSTYVINLSSTYTLATAPRFSGSCSVTGCTGLPNVSQFVPLPTSAALPFTPSANFSNYGFFVDPHLRTPYTMDVTLSYERQLPKNMSLEIAYVGTLGRRLLTKVDYGQYLDIKDPASGQTLWQAERQMAAVVGPSYRNPAVNPRNLAALSTITNIPFFQNMMPNMPQDMAIFTGNNAYGNLTPTQAYYAYELQVFPSGPTWACGIAVADRLPSFGLPSPWNKTVDPQGQGYVVLDPQFTSLGGWTNWGNANYNSLQVSLHKNIGNATFTASYVYSHSFDNSSSPVNGDVGGDYGSLVGLIQNPFDPSLNRASSDFDLRHDFNGNVLLALPFGRGQKHWSSVSPVVNALIGGWQIAGVVRWRSGFPLTAGNGFNYPTSWQRTALGTLTQPVSTRITINGPGGRPNIFSDPQSVLANDFAYTLPGFGGTRNAIRGPAFFDSDAGLYKSFLMPWAGDKQTLQLRITAFNVFNNVNFSAGAPWAPGNVSGWNGITLDPTSPSTFGQISETAGPRGGAREIEMAVRYDF